MLLRKIRKETDKPSEILNVPYLNPQNGPIFVNGAERDTLAVYIKSMKLAENNPSEQLFNFRIWWASWNQRYSDA